MIIPVESNKKSKKPQPLTPDNLLSVMEGIVNPFGGRSSNVYRRTTSFQSTVLTLIPSIKLIEPHFIEMMNLFLTSKSGNPVDGVEFLKGLKKWTLVNSIRIDRGFSAVSKHPARNYIYDEIPRYYRNIDVLTSLVENRLKYLKRLSDQPFYIPSQLSSDETGRPNIHASEYKSIIPHLISGYVPSKKISSKYATSENIMSDNTASYNTASEYAVKGKEGKSLQKKIEELVQSFNLVYRFIKAYYPYTLKNARELIKTPKVKNLNHFMGTSSLNFRLETDTEGVNPYGYSFLSHPHSDHFTDFSHQWDDEGQGPILISSEETIGIARIRYESFDPPEDKIIQSGLLRLDPKLDPKLVPKNERTCQFQLIPSGHTIGSSSLLIGSHENKADIFVTAEYRSEKNSFLPHLEPRKCRILITDLTFKDPDLIFPPIEFESKRLADWIKDNISERPIILYAYEYGKAQEMSHILNHYGINDVPIIFNKKTWEINQFCIDRGYNLSKQITKSDARKLKIQKEKNFILIVPRSEKNSSANKKLKLNRNALEAEVSGWCADAKWRLEHPADEYFIISDHPDYNHAQQFIKKCYPEEIYYQN